MPARSSVLLVLMQNLRTDASYLGQHQATLEAAIARAARAAWSCLRTLRLGGSSGSPEDYSWNTAFGPDPHARIEESERPWGAGRADSAARSPRQQQNKVARRFALERQQKEGSNG